MGGKKKGGSKGDAKASAGDDGLTSPVRAHLRRAPSLAQAPGWGRAAPHAAAAGWAASGARVCEDTQPPPPPCPSPRGAAGAAAALAAAERACRGSRRRSRRRLARQALSRGPTARLRLRLAGGQGQGGWLQDCWQRCLLCRKVRTLGAAASLQNLSCPPRPRRRRDPVPHHHIFMGGRAVLQPRPSSALFVLFCTTHLKGEGGLFFPPVRTPPATIRRAAASVRAPPARARCQITAPFLILARLRVPRPASKVEHNPLTPISAPTPPGSRRPPLSSASPLRQTRRTTCSSPTAPRAMLPSWRARGQRSRLPRGEPLRPLRGRGDDYYTAPVLVGQLTWLLPC